jgi:hydrogenase nickel incorporation protein HypA/HybF
MHELSLATSLLQIAQEQAELEKFDKVMEIHVDVGRLSCIEPDALSFCFEAIRADSIASEAKLVLTIVPGLARCRSCALEAELNNHFDPCPSCGAFGMEVLSGNTMRVTGLEVV